MDNDGRIVGGIFVPNLSMEKDEHDPLLPRAENTKGTIFNTRFKVMLYALIYNCATTITTTVEPQYVYFYIKTTYTWNNSETLAYNHTHSDTDSCDSNSSSSEKELQQLSTDWSWYMQIAEAGVALPVIILAGPIADRIGRKPVLMWNLIITFLSFVLKSVLIYRQLNLYYYTAACGLFGLAGSFYVYQITNFAILSDVTEGGKDRSFMMTLYDALSAIGIISFQIGTGYLIQIIGFIYPYLISTGMLLFICVFVQLSLIDTRNQTVKSKKQSISEMLSELFICCKTDRKTDTSFDFSSFVFKFLAYCFFYTPHCVMYTILTIFQLGKPFCWTSEDIGWYGAGASFVSFIGGVIVLKSMHLLCSGLADDTITVYGMLSYLSVYVMYGLANNKWILFAAIPAGIIRLLPISLLRALLSQMVHQDKQGVLYSAIHVVEAIDRMGGSTLFNNIYHQTLSIYRGLTFFIMAGFVFVALILMIYTTCKTGCKTTDRNIRNRQILTIENPELQKDKNCA